MRQRGLIKDFCQCALCRWYGKIAADSMTPAASWMLWKVVAVDPERRRKKQHVLAYRPCCMQ